jgi:Uma2 family endonuclease
MTTAISIPNKSANNLIVHQKPKVRKMTLEQFWAKYSDRADGFKYEFNNGLIEKTPYTKKPEQAYILKNLRRAFALTEAYQLGGELYEELEIETLPEKGRRPDVAFLNNEQIERGDNAALPSFIVEVISPTDNINRVNDKVLEYFKVGVKVVWHIFPMQEMVYVFTSPEHIKVCRGTTLCSAEPVVSGFQISANDIFKRKTHPLSI